MGSSFSFLERVSKCEQLFTFRSLFCVSRCCHTQERKRESSFLSSIFQLQHQRCKAHGPFGVLGRLATRTVFNIGEGLVIIVKTWFQIRSKYYAEEMIGSRRIAMEIYVMKVKKSSQNSPTVLTYISTLVSFAFLPCRKYENPQCQPSR